MQIRVVKEAGGAVSVLVLSQGTPPLPAVAIQQIAVSEVEERVAAVLAEFKRARVSMVEGPSP